MDSYERISRALKGLEPDRVPVIIFTDIEKNNLGREIIDYARKHIDIQHNYLCDELSYISFPGIGSGLSRNEEILDDGWIHRSYHGGNKSFSEILRYSSKGMYRNYRKHILTDTADILSIIELPYIKPDANEKFREQVGYFSRDIRDRTAANEFCIFEIHDPISFLCANADPQDASIWTLTERTLLKEYLSMLSGRLLEYLEYVLANYEMKAFYIISGAEFAIPPLMSPADFEEFVVPHDGKIVDLLHSYGKQAIIHCHGKISGFVNRFIEMGTDGIHPFDPVGTAGDCDMGRIKAEYGRKVCLIGNVQYQDLASGTPDQIDLSVRHLMDEAKENGGFIISPSCPLFQDSFDNKIEENIKSYIDAALKYGSYK